MAQDMGHCFRSWGKAALSLFIALSLSAIIRRQTLSTLANLSMNKIELTWNIWYRPTKNCSWDLWRKITDTPASPSIICIGRRLLSLHLYIPPQLSARMRSEGYGSWFVCSVLSVCVSTLILATRRPISDTSGFRRRA